MDNFHKALKTSSETVKSMYEDLGQEDNFFPNEDQQILEPYILEIGSNKSKTNLVKKISEESVERLKKITYLADYWHIPNLLPLAVDELIKKLSSEEEATSFKQNHEKYITDLMLPSTISAVVAHNFMERNPVKNYLLAEKLKNEKKSLFSLPTHHAKLYVINNNETALAFLQDEKIKLKNLVSDTESILQDSPYNSLIPVSFTKDDASLICRTDEDELSIISLSLNSQPLHINHVVSLLDTSNDGQLLAAKSQISGVLHCINLTNGSEIITHEIPDNVAITAIKIHPRNTFIATGHPTGDIYLWKPAIGKPHRLTNHSGSINVIDFDSNGSFMATGGQDQAICLWNLETGTLEHRLTQSSPIKTVTFHPNQNLIAVLTQQSVATIYDLTTKKTITTSKSKQTDRSATGSPQLRWSKNGNYLTCLHKTLFLHILSLSKTNGQWSAHTVYSGLPIAAKPNSAMDIRLSPNAERAIIYRKDQKPTHEVLELSQIPKFRKKITHSPTLPQAIALGLWNKNPQIFNQQPTMRKVIENLDPFIKKHIDLNEQ